MRLNVREAAALLRVSPKTIYRWVEDGKLPGYRVSRAFRFDHAELMEWATAHRIATAPEGARDLGDVQPIPSLDAALEEGGIVYRIGGEDRDSVLRSVLDALRVGEPSERGLLYEALRAREGLASTGIGDGLALPHLRNPLRLRLHRPSVSLCFLDRPVDWYTLDGSPVSVLFVVLASTVRAVLQLHSRTFFALRDPAFRAVVLGQGSREAILAEARRVSAALAPPPPAPGPAAGPPAAGLP